MHFVVFTVTLVAVISNIHVIVSDKQVGAKKLVWYIVINALPVLGYLIWLLASSKPKTTTSQEYAASEYPTSSSTESTLKPDTNNSKPASSQETKARANSEESRVYEKIADEIESGNLDRGLWLKLYAENTGDKKATEIAYIKQRARQLFEEDLEHQIKDYEQTSVNTPKASQSGTKTDDQVANLVKQSSIKTIDPNQRQKAMRVSPSSIITNFNKSLEKAHVNDIARQIGNQAYLCLAWSTNHETALMKAVFLQRADICQILIDSGAEPDWRNIDGISARDVAISKGWHWFNTRFPANT